jgi:hypothetical protein
VNTRLSETANNQHALLSVAPDAISKAERADLSRVARLQAKAAKSAVVQREAELLADLESELSTQYSSQAAERSDVTEKMKAANNEANAEIERRCEQLGIKPEYQPRLLMYWSSRGERSRCPAPRASQACSDTHSRAREGGEGAHRRRRSRSIDEPVRHRVDVVGCA